ncbi:response regulator [Sinorhizobium meliloti]|uniref:response regulator n=1 Tax=Rhizobium meliloti TaxID=382 RepID=UPI000B4A02A7|nr:response regulator [Sinorhizobium meliloti]ASP73957.1 response regulator [Sinorhizobium meliloti]MDE3857093.1 response regulator [Sinorhizobium meliloti]MDW9375163.1 response regulator [Sinorhizobium meliloti]MDW9493772.1 response regulator [Sinorhizobium meliloti]MDW9561876.1 response regulator [Sinorhizobium meliloti]
MKPATILLAEDEALLLLDYEAALADAGFVVVAVARGGKAIEVLRSADSEVAGVVTDIRFYELPNGWSVARVAREIYPGIPVVYGTGHGALEWHSRGVANSILLEKPFALTQLVTAVSQLLNEPVLLSVAPDPKPRTSTDYSQSVLAQMDNSWLPRPPL